MKEARARNVPLEVVVGTAPSWEEPWSRVQLAFVENGPEGWRLWLEDEDGWVIDDADVPRARLGQKA